MPGGVRQDDGWRRLAQRHVFLFNMSGNPSTRPGLRKLNPGHRARERQQDGNETGWIIDGVWENEA